MGPLEGAAAAEQEGRWEEAVLVPSGCEAPSAPAAKGVEVACRPVLLRP
jgi:hypothetical protein